MTHSSTFQASTAVIFEQLPGSWTQTRNIVPGGRYEGTAIFTRTDQDTLYYTECGIVTLDTGHIIDKAQRSYIFKCVGDQISVLFDEKTPRLFHELTLDDAGKATAIHECSDDIYNSSYHFIEPGRFTITHTVTGPRKNYVMTTQYSRPNLT